MTPALPADPVRPTLFTVDAWTAVSVARRRQVIADALTLASGATVQPAEQ
jgi:hypothetical protein